MAAWKEQYKSKYRSLTDAAKEIRSGDRIVTSLASGVPYCFLDALAERIPELENVTFSEGTMSKRSKLFDPAFNGHIRTVSSFFGAYERAYKQEGVDISYLPIHLSNLCEERESGEGRTVVLISGTPPDEKGLISLGPCPISSELAQKAGLFLVVVNENLPWVGGEQGVIPADRVDLLADGTEEIPDLAPAALGKTEETIGGYIAEMVPDGACIQLGVGNIGTAVGNFLTNKKDLGIHTEMFVESMMDLIKCGAVNNRKKELCRGVSVFGFASGSRELLKFLDHNPAVESRQFDFVNNPRVIAQLSNMVSVNSALQVDLTGQICAESIGSRQYSGSGGQGDFVRGAKWSRNGKSFIAFPSTRRDKSGGLHSKISLVLPEGSIVTTPRTDVHYVVTEYGVADLKGASLEERAKRLIAIAHPDFRKELLEDAKRTGIIL